VWAVGDNGVIIHWNGSTWSPSSSGTTRTVQGVWGSSSNDVWVAGDKALLRRKR
jgi:hypothetical protein